MSSPAGIASFVFWGTGAALLSLSSAFWGSRTICECHSDVDSQLLGVLQSQLDRCGPEYLGARPCNKCPECPPIVIAQPWFTWTSFFLGLAVGLGVPYDVRRWKQASTQGPVSGRSFSFRRPAQQFTLGDESPDSPAEWDSIRWSPPGNSTSRVLRRR